MWMSWQLRDNAHYGYFLICFVAEGENAFLQILYGNLDQNTFYSVNVLVSDNTGKANAPLGPLLEESFVK